MWSPRVLRPLEIGIGSRFVQKKHFGKWLRKALDGSGPTYVKIGQFISNRPDIFGKELSNDLAPLRDNVTPVEFNKIRDKIPSEISNIDPVPIASASIAQVHRATLKDRQVVVKIKRPEIEFQIKEDLKIIRSGRHS